MARVPNWRPSPLLSGVLLAGAACCASAYLDAFFPEWHYQQLDLSAAKEEFLATFGHDYGYEGQRLVLGSGGWMAVLDLNR